MFGWLKRWWHRHNNPTMPFFEMMKGGERKVIGREFTSWDGRCPDCDGTLFFHGPRGGLSQNIMCAKETCGTKLNVLDLPGLLQAQRI